MCDKCGRIFSENEEDWSTFSGARKRRREDGSRYTEQIDQDACPECTNGQHPVTPRLALRPGQPDYAKIATLEAETGIGVKPADG